jgi:TrmH RNA methyltransferase
MKFQPKPKPKIEPKNVKTLAKPRGPLPPDFEDSNELLYYGFHACHALFKKRKEVLIRCYCTEERLREAGPILKWCAANKKAYHVVSSEELEKVASSVHHEGIAFLAKRRPVLTERELILELRAQRSPLVILDGVQNPHNLGSMMRVMAHFGWKYMVSSQRHAVRLSSSATRISEGGSEWVATCNYQDETRLLRELKALGYHLIGTSAHSKQSLYQTKLPYPALAFVFGSETSGLSKSLEGKLDETVSLPSRGHVQSLNVGIASALAIGECVRQHGLALGG